jgi:hypothetical protein
MLSVMVLKMTENSTFLARYTYLLFNPGFPYEISFLQVIQNFVYFYFFDRIIMAYILPEVSLNGTTACQQVAT